MRQHSVIIKSNAYGLVIRLDPDIPFDQLKMDMADKFREAARFFRNAQMAVTFQGRRLTGQEEADLIGTITENAPIHIVCLVDESKESAEQYREAVVKALQEERGSCAQVHRGTVTAGQAVESETDLIILGDVNPGSTVVTRGNLIILGCCMGSVTAGLGGREDAFVAALTLKPSMLRIAGKAARSAITKRQDTGEYPVDPKIARLRDGHLVLEPLKGSSFSAVWPAKM